MGKAGAMLTLWRYRHVHCIYKVSKLSKPFH
jgi:hypothetical protein